MPYDEDGAVIARMYDRDYTEHRNPSGDIQFYVEEAERSGGPVAEFGCGTGRVLVPTAEAGIECAGVDFSPAMLKHARAKVEGRDIAIEFHRGDMRDFDLGRQFALVTIPFRAIAHLTETEDQLRCLRNMRKHLAPGGRLVFDHFQFDPRAVLRKGETVQEIETKDGDRTVRRYGRSWPHLSRQVIDVEFRWEIESPDGSIEELKTAFEMRWLHRFEVEHLLARCGLEIEAIYGDFQRAAFTDDSREMIFVCRALD